MDQNSSTSHTFCPSRTVLVLGASYGGYRAVQQLVTLLPNNWKVVVLERNTHYNHLYAFPRVSVVPGHEEKVFIPYSKIFDPQSPLGPVTSTNNELIHGTLTSLHHQTVSQGQMKGRGIASYLPIHESFHPSTNDQSQIRTIVFDYMIFALGSILPSPINTWSIPSSKLDQETNTILQEDKRGYWGGKKRGVRWLRESQDRIAKAQSILIIGGGALGVQYASDIAWTYGTANCPGKKITDEIESIPAATKHYTPTTKRVILLSSSSTLLPRFQNWMHENAYAELEKLGVEIHLGTRADLSSIDETTNGRQQRVIKTTNGKEIETDLILFCTGQRPNTDFLAGFAEEEDNKSKPNPFINPSNGSAYVTPTLQLTLADRKLNSDLQHIFVIGDAADAYGALNAGHTAFAQGEIAAKNIAKLVYDQEEESQANEGCLIHNKSEEKLPGIPQPLQEYEVESHKIKVSVGLDRAINENSGNHRIIEGGKVDLNSLGMWTRRGLSISDLSI